MNDKKMFIVEKEWGKFEQFTHNEKVTVKILHVDPRHALSLQIHKNRDEFWKVLEGEAIITVGEDTSPAFEGNTFEISRGIRHRIVTLGSPVKILEISYGNFDEDDIIRLEDQYGRV